MIYQCEWLWFLIPSIPSFLRTIQAEGVWEGSHRTIGERFSPFIAKVLQGHRLCTGSASDFPQVPLCYRAPSFCMQSSNCFKRTTQFFLLSGMSSCPRTINWSDHSSSQTIFFFFFYTCFRIYGKWIPLSPSNAFCKDKNSLGKATEDK